MKKGVTVEKLVERSRKLSKYFYLHGMFIFGYPVFSNSKHRSDLTLEQRTKAYERFFKKARIDTVQILNAVPLPGSKLRAKLEAEKRILPLEMVGWDKYDGAFLCYDPRPEDAYSMQKLPRILMKKWYLGNFMNSRLNCANWMNWTYNASVGFLIQFGIYYPKRFVHNLVKKRREKSMKLLPERNIFHEPLVRTWKDIQKKWRNLAINTYARGIVKNWMCEYKKSDYSEKLKKLFTKQRNTF